MYHGEFLLGWIFLGAVKRTQTVGNEIEFNQLKMELESVNELNANLKKRLEEQQKSNSVEKIAIQINDDEDRMPDLSGIKKEPGLEFATIRARNQKPSEYFSHARYR